jgi:acyl carrier protein
MERQIVADKLTTVIRPYVEDKSSLETMTEDSTLGELNINSLHLMDIVIDFEDAFNIEISGDEADELNRVGNALDLILRKTATA